MSQADLVFARRGGDGRVANPRPTSRRDLTTTTAFSCPPLFIALHVPPPPYSPLVFTPGPPPSQNINNNPPPPPLPPQQKRNRARCFIQCMLMYHKNPLSLGRLAALTAANLPRCLESVAAVRRRLPGLFAEGMQDADAARILGALNTNSHEVCTCVGDGGGGGVVVGWRRPCRLACADHSRDVVGLWRVSHGDKRRAGLLLVDG